MIWVCKVRGRGRRGMEMRGKVAGREEEGWVQEAHEGKERTIARLRDVRGGENKAVVRGV